MFPAHIGGLDDALFWTRGWVSNLGAVHRDVDDPVVGVLHGGRMVGLSVGPVTFEFADGRRLAVTAHIDDDMRPRYYRFNLMAADGGHLWAYHWHAGHGDLGGPHHAHLAPRDPDAVQGHPPVGFEFIAGRIHEPT